MKVEFYSTERAALFKLHFLHILDQNEDFVEKGSTFSFTPRQ